MKNNIIKIGIFIIISFILVAFDQWTKKMATLKLLNQEPKVIIKNILEFVYTENRGAAFGILQGKQAFFYVITIVVLIVIFFLMYKMELNKHSALLYIIFILIFSGAIGNFLDRVNVKYVVDFIYFKPIDFPVFNVADMYITIGCILMIISMLTIYKGNIE